MYYDDFNKQPICNDSSEMAAFGSEIIPIMEAIGVRTIAPGTIFVFMHPKQHGSIMFQCLTEMPLTTLALRGALSLIYYEYGSVVNYRGDVVPDSKIPAFRFKWCRFPTKLEFRIYSESKTI